MKVALIGNGYWGSKLKNYIPQYFDLKYIADSNFDKEVIWNDKEIEAVIIATPINTHYQLTKTALLSDKHVFVEKPLTMKVEEAEELIELAEKRDLKLAVEYTQTFSHSIQKAAEIVKSGEIGNMMYMEMSTKHLGRFLNYDVYWLLASHHLSILSMFVDITSANINYKFGDCVYNGLHCTTGFIYFEHLYRILNGRIDVSLNFPGKEMLINFYGTEGTLKYNPLSEESLELTKYNKNFAELPPDLTEQVIKYKSYDEKNNLGLAIQYFYNLINGKVLSNARVAAKITDILENRVGLL